MREIITTKIIDRSDASRSLLTISMIVEWIRKYIEKHGRKPTLKDGYIEFTKNETWSKIDTNLREGNRGLPGNSSLAKLIETEFGIRGYHNPLSLTKELIIDWIKQHFKKYDKKPTMSDGVVEFAIDEYKGITWGTVNIHLWQGGRGLLGGSSLADLNAEILGTRNHKKLPTLTEEVICKWISQFNHKYGSYPTTKHGIIEFSDDEYKGETWERIDVSLQEGNRGLPGKSSLGKLIEEKFGIRIYRKSLLPSYCKSTLLTLDIIRFWIQSYINKYGTKPTEKRGIIEFADEEHIGITWQTVAFAMSRGTRGLQERISLAQFIAKEFGIANHRSLEPFTTVIIKDWVSKFIKKYGRKPTANDGIIEFTKSGYDNITWATLDSAFNKGSRGLIGQSSLAEFIKENFGIKNHNYPPPISLYYLDVWIKKYMNLHGRKPIVQSGIVEFVDGQYKGITWAAINSALQKGRRGLPGGISLPQYIEARFEIKRSGNPPPLTESVILDWARQYIAKYKKNPTVQTGIIEFTEDEYKDETWRAVDAALRRGSRTLAGKSSLANLIHDKFGIKNHVKV